VYFALIAEYFVINDYQTLESTGNY